MTGEQFFGRERELREIQQNASTNFLVVGNRRMGKTSLVREARRRAKRELPDGDETHLYFDCSVFRNKQEFYAEIIRGLDGPREIERLYNDNTFSIHSFIQRMSRARKQKWCCIWMRLIFCWTGMQRITGRCFRCCGR